jgi:predicted outer membrane repeat protein
VIISCSNNPSEPDQEDVNPYNLQIELIDDNVVELSWEGNVSNNNSFIIAKKNGELQWIDNYHELCYGTTSLLDTIYTQSFVIYSYYLKEISNNSVVGISDTVAWFSINSIPNEFSAEQIKQDSIKLTWHDNSYGEFVYKIDKKIGNGNWVENHLFYEPNPTNGYNSYMSCVDHNEAVGDTIFYRICILNGISKSDYIECSTFSSLLSPSNLKAVIEDNGIRLNWTENCLIETGFIIERKCHGGEFQVIDTVGSDITSWLDINLDPSLIYYYHVMMFSDEFISEYSNTVIGNINHEGYWVPLDYPTIQDAIDASYSLATVIVLPGIYNANIQINNKYPIINSFYSVIGEEQYIEQTIIDGSQNGSVFSFVNCDSDSPSISGLTIRNGSGNYSDVTGGGLYYYSGGGILCENSNLTINNVIIKENSTEIGGGIACVQASNCIITNSTITDNLSNGSLSQNGGGIYCNDSQLIIDETEISNNTATTGGGGILIIESVSQITNSLISNNHSSGSAGGIYIRTGSDVTLENLIILENTSSFSGGGIVSSHTSPIMRNIVFSGNSSGKGGGIAFWSYQEPTFENILIINNNATYGGGIYSLSVDINITNVTAYGNNASYGGGVLYCDHYADPIIMNSIFWNNSPQEIMIEEGGLPGTEGSVTILYSDISGGAENISTVNPNSISWLYGNIIENPSFINPISENFHLQVNSPCIDAGNPDTEYNDVDGTINDMGVYGGPNAGL